MGGCEVLIMSSKVPKSALPSLPAGGTGGRQGGAGGPQGGEGGVAYAKVAERVPNAKAKLWEHVTVRLRRVKQSRAVASKSC